MISRPELMIVMPVYNEQASIRKVVNEWFQEVQDWTENFVFLVIDDGSKDESLHKLQSLKLILGPRLEIITRENRGHGQSCLQGYREAAARGIPLILQIDSDGQCDPQYFFRFWRMRERYDVIYGHRFRRDDGLRRVIASTILKVLLLGFCGTYCIDANVPYRLMRTDKIITDSNLIPKEFFLANVALAYLLRKNKEITEGKVSIKFRERYGGEPSVQMSKFGSKALELVRQLHGLPKK